MAEPAVEQQTTVEQPIPTAPVAEKAEEVSPDQQSMTTPLGPNEDELQEAVTGPALQNRTIESNPVQPVDKNPILQALENQAQPVTVVKETEPATDKKKDTQNKAVVRANAETVTTVRVRPLEPNAQKTPFTRQLSTRRVVTVDIIEVNTGEDKADQ